MTARDPGTSDGDLVAVLPVTFAARDILFEPGSQPRGIFIIEEGRAQAYRYAGQRRVAVAHIGRGDIIGELSMVEQRPHKLGVQALTPLKCLMITPDQFAALIEETPPVMQMILKRVVRKLHNTTAVAFGRNTG